MIKNRLNDSANPLPPQIYPSLDQPLHHLRSGALGACLVTGAHWAAIASGCNRPFFLSFNTVKINLISWGERGRAFYYRMEGDKLQRLFPRLHILANTVLKGGIIVCRANRLAFNMVNIVIIAHSSYILYHI